MRNRKKIEQWPPLIVAVALGLAFVVIGFFEVSKAAGEASAATPEEYQEYSSMVTMRTAEPETEATYALKNEAAPEVTEEPEPTEAATETEEITEETETETQTLIGSRDWGAEDSEVLLQIAMAEAEGESVEGKALVMLVVLNRVWSSGFPNSIEDVVLQNSGGVYQFSVTKPGGRYWTVEPDEGCYEALIIVRHGWDESQGALFFESCAGDSWQSRNREYLFTVGNHNFYK